MRSFRRRALLKSSAAAGAAAACGLFMSGRARAFGENPPGSEGATIPEELRAFSVLEIFLFGGLSPYESFYVVEEHGATDGTHWHAFPNEVDAAVTACGYTLPTLLQPFALDSADQEVNLGPFVAPLRQRPDILERLRIVTTTHDVLPHEAAVPLMLTGRPLSHPMVAGIGTHIQQYYQQVEARNLPYAYVLLPPSQLQVELTRVALARGPHPSTARPLSLQISTGATFQSLLDRAPLGDQRAAYDALVARRIDRYADRLRRAGQGDPVRAPAFEQLVDAARTLTSSDVLKSVLEGNFFDLGPGTACGETVEEETVGPSLRLAAHLLTHPEAAARYVCIVDGGFQVVSNAAGGYDTHSYAAGTQAHNLQNVLAQLAAIVNMPGENDESKIDLDRTMIVISSEFGRTPYAEGMLGRGHWPYAYPTLFIGGPVRSVASPLGLTNGGVFGAADATGHALTGASPTEIRIAMLLALGIWPFENESFNVSDVPSAATELGAAGFIVEELLGVPV